MGCLPWASYVATGAMAREGAREPERRLQAADFAIERHGAYFRQHMQCFPSPYKTMDTNRLTLLYFCISGLDLLGLLDTVDREAVIEFIYSWQSPAVDNGGFFGYPPLPVESEESDRENNQPHIANTYVALVMLIILGDDLRRVNRDAVGNSLRKWQLPDGSFCCVHGISSLDSESDIRFVFCAAAICFILDLWESVDVERMLRFIKSSQAYDGAFGMGPLTEAHGGCTYCALASLKMIGKLDDLPSRERLVNWCVKRQQVGFQGRIEKDEDSCYSFWVGGSLALLGVGALIDRNACAGFLKRCESTASGGFQKFPETRVPDILHSYFSVAGLSICGLLEPVNATLNMSERAYRSQCARFRTTGATLAASVASSSGLAPQGPSPQGDTRGIKGASEGASAVAAAATSETGWRSPALAVCAVVAVGAAVLAPQLLKGAS